MALGALTGMAAAMREIRRKLKEAGAISKEKAVTAEKAGITVSHEVNWLHHLVEIGQVKQTSDGKYYLE
jgi:hypothetical protein